MSRSNTNNSSDVAKKLDEHLRILEKIYSSQENMVAEFKEVKQATERHGEAIDQNKTAIEELKARVDKIEGDSQENRRRGSRR